MLELSWCLDRIKALMVFISQHDAFWHVLGYYWAIVFIEWALYLVLKKPWQTRELSGNISSTVIGAVIGPFVGSGFLGVYYFLFENFRLWTIPMTPIGALMAYGLWELAHYVQHRMNHRVGIFWAIHSVHHSAQIMDATVGPRRFWFARVGFEPVYFLLAIFGVPYLIVALISLPITVLALIHHTEFTKRIPWLETFIVTPSVHRVHHGIQPHYVDKNYGEMSTIFDHMFGTFEPEKEAPIYGLADRVDSLNPFVFQFSGLVFLWRQMASAPRWIDKLSYLVKPPEWRHDAALGLKAEMAA